MMPRTPEDLIRSQIRAYESDIRQYEGLYAEAKDAKEKAAYAHSLSKLWDKKFAVQTVLENVLSEKNEGV